MRLKVQYNIIFEERRIIAMFVFVYDAIFGYISFFFDVFVLLPKKKGHKAQGLDNRQRVYNRCMKERLIKCLHPCPI